MYRHYARSVMCCIMQYIYPVIVNSSTLVCSYGVEGEEEGREIELLDFCYIKL